MYNTTITIVHSLPLRERPVYRVQADVSACNLVELLAAIIGGPRQVEIAHEIMGLFPGQDLLHASTHELEQVPGLGQAKAARVKAAIALSQRLGLMPSDDDAIKFTSPREIAAFLMPEMSSLVQEHFRVIYLNTKGVVQRVETLYVGTLNASCIRIAEVFRDAIRRNCATIAVAHNHPSGDPTPSPEDVQVTRNLIDAGDLLDIEMLDHLIIGGHGRWVSLRERRGDLWPS